MSSASSSQPKKDSTHFPVPTTAEKSIEDGSSWLSYLMLTYLDTVFAIGNTRQLEMEDLGKISKQDRSDTLYEKFVRNYANEKKKPAKKQSLWNVIWLTVGYWKLAWALVLFGLSAAVQFGPVQVLSRLVQHFAGVHVLNNTQLWILVALLFVFPMFSSFALAHSNVIMAHLGAQTRNILICAIYRKSLVVSPYRRQEISSGRILTMFSDDTNQIRAFLFFLNNAVIAPLQIGAALYLIYREVGAATFVGLGYSIITMPITGIVFGIVFAMRRHKMKFTDARVKLMNEILNGIRIIKYYAWENAFVKKIGEIREDEVGALSKMGYIFNSIFGLLLLGGPQIQIVLIFLTYFATGHQLDAATAFTTLTLCGLMTSPFIFLPFGLQQYNQSSLAMKRIMEFLDSEDLEDYIQRPEQLEGDCVIEFASANMAWTPQTEEELKAKLEKEKEEAAMKAKKTQSKGGAKNGEDGKDGKPYEAIATVDDPEKGDESKEAGLNRAIHTLTNINLRIKKGQLVGIVGPVGSGKSSLLTAILGEMHLKSGAIRIAGKPSIAYCDQRPWIINASVKDNILFGKEYNEIRFNNAIYCASMIDDVKVLPAGLQTEIGERGINLSGGQKARVSLARAVYDDADIYLLDDPLSAVDAHVGEHIFRKCIKETLQNKTVLLVTHHLNVIPQCDLIVILDINGNVVISGSYQEIINSGIDVEQYLGITEKEDKEDGEDDEKDELTTVDAESETPRARRSSADQTDDRNRARSQSASHKDSEKQESKKSKKVGEELITKEERNSGAVTWKTYWSYITTGGATIFFFVILFQLMSQVLTINSNFWLSDWGEETSIDNYYHLKDMSLRRNLYWFHGYVGMQMASVLCNTIGRIILTTHRTTASYVFHKRILANVLFLPVSFFDVTPIGRIINRFSQDMATVDEEIASTMSQVIGMGGGCLGAVGAIAGSTKGTFLLLIVPLAFLYYKFNTYFRKSNTDISRLESVSRSPIYADFSQTLSGTSTIRAYQQQTRFIGKLEDYANTNTVPGVMQQICGQWLGLRLDLLGALVMLFMGVLTAASTHNDFIPAGYLGLGLSYAIQLTSMLKMTVRVLAQMEAQFNSVDRLNFYVDQVQSEEHMLDVNEATKVIAAPTEEKISKGTNAVDAGDIEMSLVPANKKVPLQNAPADWPSHGVIEFRNVSMRYRDGPLVLKNVSFTAQSHDKVGIAGRTGCGKSSLMVALFRIEELVTGQIYIDGIDISTLPLQQLRKRLCIIPQDPVMFSASVRFNLDPFDEYTDTQVWDVLEDVNMKDHVNSLPKKLQEMVAEGGDNFSAGQRQLICIARAILRRPKILVMDEATASIDSETDAFIQQMIRTKFSNCTVLTIAHRLHTIIDSSKILVMDAGNVGEFDVPDKLLEKPNGLFKGLWDRHVTEGGAAGLTRQPSKRAAASNGTLNAATKAE